MSERVPPPKPPRVRRTVFWILRASASFLLLPVLLLGALLPAKRGKLVWGPVPLINNRYWSEAMKQAGWDSVTLMQTYYAVINQRSDFNLYFEDLFPAWLRHRRIVAVLGAPIAAWWTIRCAAVVHISFQGGMLWETPFWRIESWLWRIAGVRCVALAYGADVYRYSEVIDSGLRAGLLLSYPEMAKIEHRVRARVKHFSRRADVVITGFMIDGMPRWDVAKFCHMAVDTDAWAPRTTYSEADGRNGPVRILHAPNHRGFKGTEFIVDAVRRLKERGLDVELVLVERVKNEEIHRLMGEVDIAADQLIATGFAMFACEAMASGLPVLANLSNEQYTQIFRRYGELNECPILSTTPETVEDHLELLVQSPKLRERLGRASRAYAEKYQSYEMTRYLFGSIYDAILERTDIDLMRLFDPRTSPYSRGRPLVDHPLVDNRLASALPSELRGADG